MEIGIFVHTFPTAPFSFGDGRAFAYRVLGECTCPNIYQCGSLEDGVGHLDISPAILEGVPSIHVVLGYVT